MYVLRVMHVCSYNGDGKYQWLLIPVAVAFHLLITNFFKISLSFPPSASSTIPSFYIQQLWDTIRFDKDKGYDYQLDEQRFYLTKATLRYALQLPQDNNNFTPPPNANTIISFVNELGYPNVVRTLSAISITQVHKRPGSPLYLPYEESALGYLKFSFKNTKRVRFGMAIPDTLIYEDIRFAPYYSEYVAKVTKYQRYLAGEVVSDDEAPAPKLAKGAKPKTPRKLKPQSTSSQPPKPKPAPAKP
ncbi:hypothetical protein Tco_0876053 [Tanacetum coccineum]|uniref:Uncharacterized protein n=1 Tax=Tanacetum coccineum TaxID=301880 RepID=A0ABQ5BTX8_9ASTR